MECNEELNSPCNFEVVDEWCEMILQNDGTDEEPDPGGNISQLRKPTEGEIDEFLENVKELASCGTSGFKDVLELNHGSDPNCSIASECNQNLAESFPLNIKNTNVSIHTSRSTVSYKPGGTLMKTIYNESLNVNADSSSLQNERLPSSDTFSSKIVSNFEISQNTFVDLREKLKKSHNLSGINTSKSDYNDNNFVVSTIDSIQSVSPRLTDLRNSISFGRDLFEQKEANLKEIELGRCEQRTNSKPQIIEEVRSKSSQISIDSRRSRSKENSSLSRIRERIGHGDPCSSRREFQSFRSRSKGRERFDRSRSRGHLDISRSRSRARLRISRSRSRASFRSSRSRSRDLGRNKSRSGDLRSNSRSLSGGLRSSSRSRSRVIQRNSRDSRRSRRSRTRDLGRSRSRSEGYVKGSRSRSRSLGRSSRSRSRVGVIRRSNSKASSSQYSITGRSNSRRSRERIKSSRSPGRKSFISLSPSPISGGFVTLGPTLGRSTPDGLDSHHG